MGKNVPNHFKSEKFLCGFELFLMNYKQWLISMELEPEIDPSVIYSQPTPQIPDEDA